MKKLLKYLSPKDWTFIIINMILIFVRVFLELKIPDYMEDITETLQNQGQFMEIIAIGKKMLFAAFIVLLLAFVCGFLVSRVGALFSKKLRFAVFDKVNNLSEREVNYFSTDSLITRSTNDIIQVQNLLIMGTQLAVRAPVMAAMALWKIMGKNGLWTGITFLAVVIIVSIVFVISKLSIPKFKKVQKLIDGINRVTREGLEGIREVRAFNGQSFQEEKFFNANNKLMENQMYTGRVMAILNPVMRSMVNILSLVIYWTGSYIIVKAAQPQKLEIFSDMVVFSSYAVQVIMSFMMLSFIFVMLPRVMVSVNRVKELLEKDTTIKEGVVTEAKKDIGLVEFEDVTFSYYETRESVLDNISFTLKPGETMGIIGPTGSGKSTVAALLLRLYDPTSGVVKVNGIDTRDYKLESLYENIAYVSQKALLLSGTVESNLSFGEDNGNSAEELLKALEISQALDFIDESREGLSYKVSQRGSNFSGGQKQRLSIARGLVKKAPIMIFDDSFSALDLKTDKALRSSLQEHSKNSTKIIISQRISSIMNADKIMVLEEGKIKGFGNHKELMKSCELYQEIASTQLSIKEEVGDEDGK
ncbi:ABC transporter ATP-binding protein [Lagierella massiliensis]|uniref:ABC transporter ATP-binding protein n=1 Tax=Lagierella massiliensis TaxID=1689303 RepID=UPI0006D7D350|nr:ABC transporter ATP-binding protein [Lagierella massiliensis]